MLTEQYPQLASSWKSLGVSLIDQAPSEARDALLQGLKLAPDDYAILELLSKTEHSLGNTEQALVHLREALRLKPDLISGHLNMAKMLYRKNQYPEALVHITQANSLAPDNEEILFVKGNVLYRLNHHEEANSIFEQLVKQQPKDYRYWNDGANVKRDLGQFEEADEYYHRAIALAENNPTPFSNRLNTLHYRPNFSRDIIFEVCKEWQRRFAPAVRPIRPTPHNISKTRAIKIGMFSDGFRSHPVGFMITAALENLAKHEIELYAYSTTNAVDHLTARIQATSTQWMSVQHLSEEEFAQRLRDDGIDILIDLSGHAKGSRMRTMTMEPAPILVKWVGGLLNTTGINAIDYLLTDNIESPNDDDKYYTEKLIRMPDDYICYAPPEYRPDVGNLPAFNNGYITLGCFNNPLKINEVLLSEWAKLMLSLPQSCLFLKGHQYNSERLCQSIRNTMARHGIIEERLIIEGPSSHNDLLEAYNRIDIALDPWPYSGGLTTCEAMLMGVPVVTLPGPTFAGRHSATHLVNAGMSELVVDNWDEYRDRVIGLASDLNSLAIIRTHLRSILLQSPVCDGQRFAKNFTTAMRAIWQRYCEAKSPAALTIDKQGQAWFDGENHPMKIERPPVDPVEKSNRFRFSFMGKITTLDNGAILVGDPKFAELHKLGAFSTIVFDPVSKVDNAHHLQQKGDLHHFPHTLLGDGQATTLFACIDPNMSATLEPLPVDQQLPGYDLTAKLIAKLPIKTQRLDSIEGLQSVDWVLLDNLNDSLTILQHGKTAIANALLIQVRINFAPTHHHQPELTSISTWLAAQNFSFYRLNNPRHHSPLAHCSDLPELPATQLIWADAIFVPNKVRMAELSDNQRLKLAFVLHTVYRIYDFAYKLINEINTESATAYLTELTSDPATLELIAHIAVSRETHTKGSDKSAKNASPAAENSLKAVDAITDISPTILTARKKSKSPTKTCIGIPVYNEEKYIGETLMSLKAQNVDDVQFFITDNRSKDKTMEICRDLILDDERFSIYQHERNIGAFENFEFALSKTDSQYFMWIGGHDFISSQYIETAIQELDVSPHVSMVFGQPYAVVNSAVEGPVKEAIYDFSDKNPLNRYILSVATLSNCSIFHSLFRRKSINRFSFQKTISFDHVFISHLLWQGKLQYMEEEKYYRRYFAQRESSQSERISGDDTNLSRAEFYKHYLEDFSLLYQGENSEKKQLEKKILHLLEKRFNV
jgi:predicted O-linked N-acetylglucosamine transferase (SPINDLY family)/glycosyltransferase involved in cell wall biosynthesis